MQSAAITYCFGPFELHPARYELLRGVRRIRIPVSLIELLLLFVSRPGELVTREQIVAVLWKEPQSVDVRQGINTAVARLRAALEDDPVNPRFLETVIGKGYRFIAQVKELEQEESRQTEPDLDYLPVAEEPVLLDSTQSVAPEKSWEAPFGNGNVGNRDLRTAYLPEVELPSQALQPARGDSKPSSDSKPHRSQLVLWGTCATVVAILVVLAVRNRLADAPPHPSQLEPAIRSLAVIPLVNLSDDKEQQYFADGLTDALISNLAAGTRLRVTSRASSMHFQGLNLSSGTMAKELGVDALVEGSVLRVADRMHITVHLVDTRLDRDLWTQTFDTPLSSSLAVVDTIGKRVSESVVHPGARVSIDERPVTEVDPRAYDDYLRGRYLWKKRDLPSVVKAIEYFKRAVAEQPGFALAHAGLSDAYLVSQSAGLLSADEAKQIARREAEEAVRLGPQLAEAHTSLALVDQASFEWPEAELEYRRAIAIDSSYSTARQWYSNYLSLLGRHAEAIEQARLGVESDPLSPMIQTQLGVAYYYARRYDEAIAEFKKTLEMEPHFCIALGRLGVLYALKGMYTEALATLRSAPETEKACIEYWAYVEGRAGHTAEASILIRRMEEAPPDPIGLLYATLPLGDRTRSFELMRLVIATRQPDNFAVEPVFDPLRSDSRYQEILKEMKRR